MTRAVGLLAEAVADRSAGRCELYVDRARCERRAVAIHHRLPRARARLGDEHLLDLAGDADNLAHLCRTCHDLVHARAVAAQGWPVASWWGSTVRGAMVPGSVSVSPDGGLVYVGLSEEYRRRVPALRVR